MRHDQGYKYVIIICDILWVKVIKRSSYGHAWLNEETFKSSVTPTIDRRTVLEATWEMTVLFID